MFDFFKSPVVRPANVRVANTSDEKNLRRLLDRLHDDNPNPGNLSICDQKVWAHVNACCRGQGGIAGVIDDGQGDLIGSIGLFMVTPWWTEDCHLSQYWLHVSKEHRRSGRLYLDLIQFAKWHRADMSARLGKNIGLENSFITKDDIMPRLRLWRRTAKPIGVLFWMDK